MTTRLALTLLLVLINPLVACRATPPPLWAEGGSPLTFTASIWTQSDGERLGIDAQGRVWKGTELLYSLDRAGRVVDESNEPVALLDPGGQLFGTNKTYWGRIGLHNASPPWAAEAWLRVTRAGEVVLFDADGDTVSGGQWSGCQGHSLRACTLITHLVLLDSVYRRQSAPDMYFGFGFGYY